MAILDDFGKKISNASQSAVQKTQEKAALSRLNSMIQAEEKKIKTAYLQIGKLYVSVHSSDYEGDFAAPVNAVKEAEQNIVNLKQQVQTIKGTVTCGKCGEEVPRDMAFCCCCGAKLTATAFRTEVKCRACGAVNTDRSKFCSKCGQKM